MKVQMGHLTEICQSYGAVDSGAVLLRKEPPNQTKSKTDAQQDFALYQKSDEVILCKNCRHAISSAEYAVQINKKHQHTLCNPAGIVFEILCFQKAPGCIVQGSPRLEFTWFAGFAWNFAFCSNCSHQLGWFFQKEADEPFFGLDESMLCIDHPV